SGAQHFVRMLRILRIVERAAQGYECGAARILRQKHGREILVAYAGPLKGPADGVSADDFLQRDTFDISAVLILDAAGRVGRGTSLISETRWPHRQGRDRRTLLLNR